MGAKFAAYLENVEDFDVDIDYRSNSWFMNNYEGKPEEWASDLQKYDMLILGFSDVSSFTDQEDFLYGFQKFVASGKSVILGHDIVQDKSFAYPVYDDASGETAGKVADGLERGSGDIHVSARVERTDGALLFQPERGRFLRKNL